MRNTHSQKKKKKRKEAISVEKIFEMLQGTEPKVKILRKVWRKELERTMALTGEYFIGRPTTDYILDVFIKQGYWSGIRYNIFYNTEYGRFIPVPRAFRF